MVDDMMDKTFPPTSSPQFRQPTNVYHRVNWEGDSIRNTKVNKSNPLVPRLY